MQHTVPSSVRTVPSLPFSVLSNDNGGSHPTARLGQNSKGLLARHGTGPGAVVGLEKGRIFLGSQPLAGAPEGPEERLQNRP